MQNQVIINFLDSLGLEAEEVIVYLKILELNLTTPLKVSKLTGVNRTKVYRIIEKLARMGILEIVIEERGTMVRPANLNQLESLIRDKEIQVNFLKQSFHAVANIFNSMYASAQPETKVIFYLGSEGIKQMVWNVVTGTKKEAVGYTYRRLEEITGAKFGSKWREEWLARKLVLRDIYSDEYLSSISKLLKDQPALKYSLKNFPSRYISAKILDINYQSDIYGDVVNFYSWYQGEIFGIEIYNKKIAGFQRKMFEIIWKMAEEEK